MTNRRANATEFGFDFQTNAAIVLMLDYIKDLETLNIEGELEDIQIKLTDNQYVIAQAKAVTRPADDFNNVLPNLKKALTSLSEGASKANVKDAIFVTNSANPFKDDSSRSQFFELTCLRFKDLALPAQKTIIKYLKEITNSLDEDKLIIRRIPFETDNETERYKAIKVRVEDFMASLNLTQVGLANKLMNQWQLSFQQNSTKSNPNISFSKKQILWQIIVLATDIDYVIDNLANEDSTLKQEALSSFQDIINSSSERFAFMTKIINDCDSMRFSFDTPLKEKVRKLTESYSNNYINLFGISNLDPEVQQIVMKAIIHKILDNRITLGKIKDGTNL